MEKGLQESKLHSSVFKIPIEKYEKDIDTELPEEKKKEILDSLINCINFRSEEEFQSIEDKMHEACKKGDIELIKIYLNETIEDENKDLSFKIDKTNQTASLFNINDDIEEITIPRTVKHESTEYLITSVSGTSYGIRILKFVEDSAVKTIYGNVFQFCSCIEEIHFPSSLNDLKEGWCNNTECLTKIIISPSNGQFKLINDKYLLGKNNGKSDEFDILLFARRDIIEISIPSNIKIISPYAFQNCMNLTKVEIQQNSNLQTIKEHAFSYSKIKEIFIPSKVTKICKYAFFKCSYMKKVEFSANSNLQTIEENAFYYSRIEEISIPSKVSKIGEHAFSDCFNLSKVEINPNSNLQAIECGTFIGSNIKRILIPSKVLKICEDAFSDCNHLTKVEIPPNSKLQTIEKNAFSNSNINEIYFPSNLIELEKGWCLNTKNLTKITISPSNNHFIFKDGKCLLCKSDKNNVEFDILLFANRNLKEFSIPSYIKIISLGAFQNCQKLTKIEIPKNSKLEKIDKFAFSNTNIREIFIPLNIKIISSFAFDNCEKLTKVEIPTNSNLQRIGKYAFSKSNIKKFSIPLNVKTISMCAFGYCTDLTKFKILQNSNLQIIKRSAFFKSAIKEMFIPSNVSIICENAFEDCSNLQIVEISEESKLESFPLSAFVKCPKLIIMIPSSSINVIRSIQI